MTDWIDQLDDTELKVFNGQLAKFPNDEAIDGVMIKWLDSEGRTADVITVRLHRYIRDSGRFDVTGADFLAYCDENNVEGYAGTEAKGFIAELRESADYQAEIITMGDLSFRMTAWRKEVDAEREALWGEWWEAWQEARRGLGLISEPGTAVADGTDAAVPTENADAGAADGHVYEDAAAGQALAAGQFDGAHAWVNGLDPNQWAAFSGAEHTGLDQNVAMRVWADASGRSEVVEVIDLYDYLMSLAGSDATMTAPEFLAWYDAGWSAAADADTRSRVERLRTADAATQADPAQVGSAVHPWRRSLDAQISGWSDQWWAAWQASQAAGGYAVGVKPATTPTAAAPPAVTIPHEYENVGETAEHEAEEGTADGYLNTDLANLPPVTDEDDEDDEEDEQDEDDGSDLPDVQADEHGYTHNLDALSQPSAPTANRPPSASPGTDASGYLDTDLANLPPVTDEDDEEDEQDEDDGSDLPDVQADEHGYVHNLDALSQVDSAGEQVETSSEEGASPGAMVRGYADDNALDKLFEYFNGNDITTVMASVQHVDGGAALDRLAQSYPSEFGGWFDAAASQEVQTALLGRAVVAGVIRAHRAATDPRSRQPRKDAAAAPPARMKLQPAQLGQIDAANKAAIASIERGGELTWYAGGAAVLIGQDHQAEYLAYNDEQPDRVSGTVIVRRVRVGTGPVVFFDVPPAKQEMVASAARRATSRKPVFESRQ